MPGVVGYNIYSIVPNGPFYTNSVNFDRFMAKFKTNCFLVIRPISGINDCIIYIFYDLWFS
jgi:hypothetical protein